MFGTLRIDRRRLDDATRQAWRAAFCTSCHALRDLGGRPASLLTNYDQTVLAVVLAGLLDGDTPRTPAACTALPWRTVSVDVLPTPSRALLAALDVAAVTAKLKDDVDDARSWRARAGLRLLRGLDDKARAALRTIGFPLSIFDELPVRQRAVEADPTATIDDLAAPSAELTGQIFAHAAVVTRQDVAAPTLARLGAALGRYVYGLDAWEDRRRDACRGEFNAWQHVHGDRIDGPAVAAWLAAALADARAAIAALPDRTFRDVLSALLDSAGDRVSTIRGAGTRNSSQDLREAGECDVACCEPDCCSGGDDGGCCSSPCSGGDADAGTSSSGGGVWYACLCCDPLCCWDGRRSEERQRRGRRRGRRALDLDDPELDTPERWLGHEVVAVTDLTPHGRVTIDGAQFDAMAEGTMAAAGESLVVLRVDRGLLIVGRPSRGR